MTLNTHWEIIEGFHFYSKNISRLEFQMKNNVHIVECCYDKQNL